MQSVKRQLVESRGGSLTPAVAKAGTGMRPLEATEALIAAAGGLGGCDAAELQAEGSRLLAGMWGGAELMPGAARALRHLAASGVPLALATSSPAHSVAAKVARHPILTAKADGKADGMADGGGGGGVFEAVVTGDEVARGKPHPDCFLLAMERVLGKGADPRRVIVSVI